MPKLVGKTSIDNIFEKPIVKNILACFEKNTRIRFCEIRSNINYRDELLSRELKEMVGYGILKKEICPQPRGKPHVYYLLTDKYLTKIHQTRLSWLIESYSPEDVLDYPGTAIFGLPYEVYYPNKYEIASEHFYDLYIQPQDIFRDDSLFVENVKKRSKEIVIKSINEKYKNKTKDELIEELKKNALSQLDQELSLKHSIPPYEACKRIVNKLVEGRGKYRLLLIQREYESQLDVKMDSDFKQYLQDYQEYYTQKLNLLFDVDFVKATISTSEVKYELDFENKLYFFHNANDNKLPMDIAHPPSESISKWTLEILNFLENIRQNIIQQTKGRINVPITIVSSSFTATFAAKEFWETDDKIRKIIKRGEK